MLKFPLVLHLSLLGLATTATFDLAGTPTSAAPPLAATATRSRAIQIFLPKKAGPQQDLSYVEPVWRQASTASVAQFAIAQVVAGPTRQEQQRGFTAPITLRGTSNCGRDFTLAIVSNVARLQFCRSVLSGGVGDDARMTSALKTTLKQFPTIRSVVLLDQNGNCLGDLSGDNRCLRP